MSCSGPDRSRLRGDVRAVAGGSGRVHVVVHRRSGRGPLGGPAVDGGPSAVPVPPWAGPAGAMRDRPGVGAFGGRPVEHDTDGRAARGGAIVRLWITVGRSTADGPPSTRTQGQRVTGPIAPRPSQPTVRSGAQPRGGTVRRALDHAQRVRAFEAEALPHLDRLYGAALRYVRRPADADDLVQEALTTAFRAYHQVEEGSNERAWLYRVLHTTFLSQYRRDGRRPIEDPTEDVEAAATGAVDPIRGSTPSAEQAAMSSAASVEVRDALAALPEGQRVAVYLADVEGFAYREIADIMATPVGTVMSRLHRGRAALRTSLAGHAGRGGLVTGPDGDEEDDG